jgi:hypothetical protein
MLIINNEKKHSTCELTEAKTLNSNIITNNEAKHTDNKATKPKVTLN